MLKLANGLHHHTEISKTSFEIVTNACQCLDCAGLFEDVPAQSVVDWWDNLAMTVRADNDVAQLRIGREGELLSMAHETERLAAAGRPELKPKWVAVDDNTLGYDVRSYDFDRFHARAVYIEVKCSYASPPRFFLSRSEWEKARLLGMDYRLHLWQLPMRRLHLLALAQLAIHVPLDQGMGKWHAVEIRHPAC